MLDQMEPIPKIPPMRVMSISVKTIEPCKLKTKRLFNTNNTEELHIYALAYHFCDKYDA